MKITETNGPGEEYLSKFKPLQVEVRSGSREDFEYAAKAFKNLVNREKVIADYKAHQSYEKPSEKKRRKRREAEKKRYIADIKQQLVESGEWERRQKNKAKRQNKE